MRTSRFLLCWAVSGTLVATGAGCQNMNNTQKGALLGGGGGAAVGAIVGKQLGSTGAGALIGGLAGGLTGSMVGNSADEKEQKDKYAAQVAYERGARYRDQRSMSNRDVVDMVQNSTNDRIIISSMRNRGTKFDTSPQAIIALQQHGVSDAVIQAMQDHESRQ